MSRPVIGWESNAPVHTYQFTPQLHARQGQLFYEDLNLAELVSQGYRHKGEFIPLPSPLEVAYLPSIRRKVKELNQTFAAAINHTGYPGRFHYAYASKANTNEEVVRSALAAGAHYEMSSRVDVEIARLMQKAGHLPPERMVIANGFKGPGTAYSYHLIEFRRQHPNLIPVVEDRSELTPLLNAGQTFDVGLRLKSYGYHQSEAAMLATNSRFGLKLEDLEQTAAQIEASDNLRFKLFHAMIGSQILDPVHFVNGLKPALQIYARLRQQHPDLTIFDFGGGIPVGVSLDFSFNYYHFARLLLVTVQEICAEFNVPPPDIMAEPGRYTVAEHGMHFFKVINVKQNDSPLPWYILNGSIMSSFPDIWALGEHFVVLPLTHLDKPFHQVQLGGITCDSGDIYPPENSRSPLYLPVETDDLYIGFFNIGAYQEMLGGVRGSKHCVLPEATELIVDCNERGKYHYEVVAGQTTEEVLENLGY